MELKNKRSKEIRILWQGTRLRMPQGGQVAQSKQLKQETKERGKGGHSKGDLGQQEEGKARGKIARQKSGRNRG